VSPATGYAHPDFAKVYADVGEPVALVASGGTLLRRKIAGTSRSDLTGCYPFFCCADWSALGDDLATIATDAVSVVLVTDPFVDRRAEQLGRAFGFARPFKTHYVADLSEPLASFVPSERMREARSAARQLEVEVASSGAAWAGDWLALWDRSRHARNPSGENRLSRQAVERLFGVPGVTVIRAIDRGRTVGMHVEVQQGEIVHGHFATYDPDYYRLGVSTLLTVFELEHFASQARFYNHGGVPGAQDGPTGLSRFKRDFANTTRTAYLCGSVLDPAAYDRLTSRAAGSEAAFFPAYRAFDPAGETCQDTRG
jgi:hypothetical protein